MTRPDEPSRARGERDDARAADYLAEAARRVAHGVDELRERLQPCVPDYELGECIGRGGAGAVFRARQRNLDRVVAIKALLPPPGEVDGWAERFRREARALARLQHPGIVTVHDYGQSGELAWLVMEFVEGADLRALMADGRMSAAEALAIVPPICEALQFAHERGIVHRDVKPENVLLDLDGRVRLVDFGLAKLTGGDDAHLTRSGQAMGTPRYMAPEQLERPLEVDHRADIFSLGVVLYEMLTGHVPAGVVEPPSRKVAVDVRLDEVVLRALQREPEKRYQSAGELETDVRGVGDAGGSAAASEQNVGESGAVESGYTLAELIAICVLPVTAMIAISVQEGAGRGGEAAWQVVRPFAWIGAFWLGLPAISFVHWRIGRRGERVPRVSMPLVRVAWAAAGALLAEWAYRANHAVAIAGNAGPRGVELVTDLWHLHLPCALLAGLFGAYSRSGAHRRVIDAAVEKVVFVAVLALAAVPVAVGAFAAFTDAVPFSALASTFSKSLPATVQLPVVLAAAIALSLRRADRVRAGALVLAVGLAATMLAHGFCELRYGAWSTAAYLSLDAALLLSLFGVAASATPKPRSH